jgi:penicillin amidase
LTLLVIVLAASALAAWFIRSPLPKTNGTLNVAGITGPITIRRDERGIAHIAAASEADLFFGEGFACAQDRLWQMDLLRRTAEGKLSEVVGPATLKVDRYMRTIGLGVAAAHDASILHGQALVDAQAYAAGVNAEANSKPLPLEFHLLGYKPDPWTPTDSIAIIKLMAQRLDDQWDLVELRALLGQKVGPKAAAALMNVQVPSLEHFINASPHRGVGSPTAAHANPALASLALVGGDPMPPDPQSGSNNWALSAMRTTTGKPVLSNDTHLEHSVPSTYWLVQLDGAGMDVEGFIIPGIPFVALGHNRRIAFGVTSGDVAVQDLYIEKFRSPTSDEYLADGRWLRASHRRESIGVKGFSPQILDVLVTRHGPLVKRAGASGYALAWTILRTGDELDLLRALDFASGWSQFESGLAHVVGPMFNWAYADVDGNIGYHLAGEVPNRLHGDGSLPVEGQDDRYAWHGFVPFDQLPHAFNPRLGFVATANNQLQPATTQIGSSPFFDAPYRIDRIYKRLRGAGRMTPQQIGDIQLDDVDAARLEFARDLAHALGDSTDARLARIATQLGAWDGSVTATSAVPTYLIALEDALANDMLRPHLGAALLKRYRDNYNVVTIFNRVLAGDNSLRSIGMEKRTLLAALPAAARSAADTVDATSMTGLAAVKAWGPSNAAIFDHPLGVRWPLDVLLNIRPFGQAGDGLTVYAAKPDHGPASRLVDDLADWDDSSMTLTLGESGQFNDPHYQDEVTEFAQARWVELPFSDAAVKSATKDTLVLNPNQ